MYDLYCLSKIVVDYQKSFDIRMDFCFFQYRCVSSIFVATYRESAGTFEAFLSNIFSGKEEM